MHVVFVYQQSFAETPEPITEEESHRQKSCRVCGDHAVMLERYM